MIGPMAAPLSTLADAERRRASVARAAQERWSDRAQREFWSRVLAELDREANRYQGALTGLTTELQRALNMIR